LRQVAGTGSLFEGLPVQLLVGSNWRTDGFPIGWASQFI
jgi:hypothetical protein